jgi:hypothetical protein
MRVVGDSEKFLRSCRRAFERGSPAALVVCVGFLLVAMTAPGAGRGISWRAPHPGSRSIAWAADQRSLRKQR